MGLPNSATEGLEKAASEYADALVKAVVRYVPFERAIRLTAAEAGIDEPDNETAPNA